MLPAIAAAAIAAGGGIASSMLNNHAAKKEAARNRDFQADMSNTAIRRRVEDLKYSGLNPLLAVGSASSGASTPTGNTANLDYSGIGNGVASGVQMYQQYQQNKANIEKTQEETEQIRQKVVTEKLDQIGKELDNTLKKGDQVTQKLMQEYQRTTNLHERYKIAKTIAERNNLEKDGALKVQQLLDLEQLYKYRSTDYANTEEGQYGLWLAKSAPNNPYASAYQTLKHAQKYLKEVGYTESGGNAEPQPKKPRIQGGSWKKL